MSIPTTPGAAPGHQPAGDQQDSPGQVVIQPAGRGPATWALGRPCRRPACRVTARRDRGLATRPNR